MRKMLPMFLTVTLLALGSAVTLFLADTTYAAEDEDEGKLKSGTFSGLEFRGIGPALTSGRIGDFAVHPTRKHVYYVAVCSGGVWKTENAGSTWEPIFDGEGSYSIGCVTVDQQNPLNVWVGTGENNSQRSVAYGDGLYRSSDGGQSFEKVGLEESEHIGKILVDPRDSDIVWVAAQGPLWRAGGDRGLYRTLDGGANWELSLEISENTGVSDIVMDPRDPDVLYASAYQRRRHTWTLIDGGPESAIYKTTDGGTTWNKLTNGLPDGDLGRIGLAIAPMKPDVLYAIVEAVGDKGGFFRSTDAGGNWSKMNDYLSSSPQYYQEIVADPVDPNRVYSLDTFTRITEDGGNSFERLGLGYRHVDDHAMWIDPDDTDHMLIGGDGGIYESWNRGEQWEFKANLPVTQFYKLCTDNDFPFYNIYGGTQDNNTIGGPSRTTSLSGIVNSDWYITLGGDGFEPQVDPENPDIVYSQYQYGGLARYDRQSGEQIYIQPQPEPGDEPLKWNWSSPLLISPHANTRLYYACQKIFRSDDQGNSWTPISGDLTRRLDRNRLEVMGQVWGIDTVAKNRSTSFFGNIVSLAESPLQAGLLYAGTDDGLIQVSEDGGESWTGYETFKGVPDMAYVSYLTASLHDAGTVYAAFDNHKQGDFAPYVLKSTDRGKSWRSIAGDLPARGHAHAVVQDHVLPDLLFVGTEFGVFFTLDGGEKWLQLKAGIPTVACRDLEIQRRENDLVVATFGRGFYVLDDYTPLRGLEGGLTEADLEQEAILFPVKQTWMYMPSSPIGGRDKGSQGDAFYNAPNPPYGAVFTYYLGEGLQSLEEQRQEREKELREAKKPVYYPDWDDLRA
ncbi:MAG: glycosyl hydrolase, partial [bacterium]